jgi:hypothetical protein
MLISSLVTRRTPTVPTFTTRSLFTLAEDLQSVIIESGENYDLYPIDADTRRLKSTMLDVRTATVSSDRIRTSQKTMNDTRHSMFSWFFSHKAYLAENTLKARNHKSTYALIWSVRYFRSILTTTKFPPQIFAKSPIKMLQKSFQYEPSYSMRTDGQTWWDDGHFSCILHTHTDGHMSRDISCFCNFPTLLQHHILHKTVACPVHEIVSIAKCA